jgi:hypothetical protein
MESETFDALTRSAGGEAGTRRVLLRLLAGGALGVLATRLGLAEDATAKAKQHQAKAKQKRGPQAERKAHGQLQAAGKRKHKDKHRDNSPENPPPPPPSDPKPKECDGPVKLCQQCETPGCIDGDWICISNGEKPCRDGSCALWGECCLGEDHCSQCEEPICLDGDWVCRSTAACGVPCGDGYCLPGMWCDHPGTCCGTPPGGTYSTCLCASGYTGPCNGQCCKTGCCGSYCCESLPPT